GGGVPEESRRAGDRDRAEHHAALPQRYEKADRWRLAEGFLECREDGDLRNLDHKAALANDHAAAEQAGERVGFRQRQLSGLGGDPIDRLLGGFADALDRLRPALHGAFTSFEQRLRAALEIAE